MASTYCPTGIYTLSLISSYYGIISQSRYESMSWDAETGLHSLELTVPCRALCTLPMKIGLYISATSRTLGKPLPCWPEQSTQHERGLALGTNSGHVFVLRIPPALLTSPETRVVDGKVRERYVNAMLHLADDLSEDDRIGQVDQKY